jgi:hypothetical protein
MSEQPIQTEEFYKEIFKPALETKIEKISELVFYHKLSKSSFIQPIDDKLTSFIRENGKLPILLLTCNRPELLEKTINSLLSINGIEKEYILVSQDGTSTEVKDITIKHGLRAIQNTDGIRLRGGVVDGGSRISQHYKFSLTNAFKMIPNAPAFIIVEDDLLFSPDFYEYFTSVAPILDYDPSLFIISAWNDNGFKNVIAKKHELRRTDYFPGLGWLLTKKLYKTELEEKWPREHWDHWLRSFEINKHREILYPQVPRTFHNGVKGTFMTQDTHNRYFKNIGFNEDKNVNWKDFAIVNTNNILENNKNTIVNNKNENYIVNSNDKNKNVENVNNFFLKYTKQFYELRILELIKFCKHLSKIEELFELKGFILLFKIFYCYIIIQYIEKYTQFFACL